MCTRLDAIKLVVNLQRGKTKELETQIGHRFYKSFVALGFIAELLPVPQEMQCNANSSEVDADWEVTDIAREKARFFSLVATKM